MSELFELPPQGMTGVSLNAYLYKLANQLNYVVNNLSTDNFTEVAQGVLIAGNEANMKLVELTEEQKASLQQYRKELLQEIINSATTVANNTTVAIQENKDNIQSLVATMYVAKTEGDDTSTVADLKQFTSSLVTQTDESLRLDFSTTEEIAADTKQNLENFVTTNNLYIRFSALGMEIGKKTDQGTLPFSVVIDNEKMSFKQNGVEIAYVKNDKMFVTETETTSRSSLGSSVNGYLDMIPTATGVGFKWREVV